MGFGAALATAGFVTAPLLAAGFAFDFAIGFFMRRL
jgi:hypothetical protein